jgi:SAM-dependent methyltransferase
MYVAEKAKNVLRGLLQAYGTNSMKRGLWNKEFDNGRWMCLDHTSDDFVYPHIEKYARGGEVLDMGCGSGSTGNELNVSTYRHYTGVDISDVAVRKAQQRSDANGRAGKNDYVAADIFDYVPRTPCDVILFRDSIYYVRPVGQIRAVLERYSRYLTPSGVFVVRMYDTSGRYARIVTTIETSFDVLERDTSDNALVIVFRPRRTGRGGTL